MVAPVMGFALMVGQGELFWGGLKVTPALRAAGLAE